MFKAPEWEDDVPKTLTSFIKKNQVHLKKKEKKSPASKIKQASKVNKLKEKKKNKLKINVLPKVAKIKELKPVQVKTKVSENSFRQNKPTLTNGIKNKSRKRKLDAKPANTVKKTYIQSEESPIPETQNFDEVLLNAKKKKFNEVIENEDKEDLLFTEKKPTKKRKKEENQDNEKNDINDSKNLVSNGPMNSKKNRLRALLANQSNRRPINVENKGNKLRERMLERLKAAQFRYLNEKLYTSSGSEAQQLFKDDPLAFETYHQGYQLQVKKWPVNPLDVIIKKIMKMPKSHLIADMGCGEAALSRRIPHTVRSFDLVANAPGVEACDMARTPLLSASMDVAVYCLALMGTDLTQYLVEANRVLKTGGHLLIAEVESRFDNVENFTKEVQRLGFKLKQLDKSNKVFYFMEFTKVQDPPTKKAKLPVLTLKPCIYKRR
ncbi:unnamed protein product [Arctia plantaginis]|uniref:Ribosomal RNA-processing protein 8 n=1 Tax=Arctia plantaginis TaxID=874455 RepID=A0A8S0YTU0_ARCPL|nr:unnamed protein product [Arctia plantaginis]